MTLTSTLTARFAFAAALCTLAAVPQALAAITHQTPTSHRAKPITRNALTTGAWTPMIDESRLEPPFNRVVADYAATLAWLHNRP